MTNTQIKEFVDYIVETEKSLHKFNKKAMKNEMSVISQKIQFVMDEISKTPAKDVGLIIVLASMETKLRDCLDCLKSRAGVNN